MTQLHTTTSNRSGRRARTRLLAGVALLGVLGAVGAAVLLGGSDSTEPTPAERRSSTARVATAVVAEPVPGADVASEPGPAASAASGSAGAANTSTGVAPAPGPDPVTTAPADGTLAPGTLAPGGYTIERVCCLAPETPGVITTIPPVVSIPHLTLPPGVVRSLLPGAGLLPTPMVTLPPIGH